MRAESFTTKKGNKYFRFIMSESAYHGISDDYGGACVLCGEFLHDGLEPDARKYECMACDKPGAYGMQELLMMGLVRFEDSESESKNESESACM